MTTDAMINKSNINFQMNLIHEPHSTRAAPNVPISAADVGTIIFVKPSPNWKANTAVCLVTPTISAKGAIIGIVSAAYPDPETTKKLKTDWKIYMNQTDKT